MYNRKKIKHCTTEVKQKLHFVDKIQNATPEPDPPKKKSTYWKFNPEKRISRPASTNFT